MNSVMFYSIINRPASIPFMLFPPPNKQTNQPTKRKSHIMIIPGYFFLKII